MYTHYIITTLRNLLRRPIFSLLNILGLALGMAACLFILMYVNYEKSYENFHSNSDRIVRLSLDLYEGGTVNLQDVETYRPIGPMLKRELPEVVQYAHLYHAGTQDFTINNQVFTEDRVYITEPYCFELFTHNFLYGDKETALDEPYEVVITQSTAQKYFGKVDVVGEVLEYPLRNHQNGLKIAGVIEDVPPNTHIKYDILISYETGFSEFGWEFDEWNSNNEYTYLLLRSKEDIPSFEQKLEEVNDRLTATEQLDSERIISQPIQDIHLYSHKTFEPETNGDARAVQLLTIIAIFIIVLACVNYINLSTARSLERAKEVGIKKVIGSRRKQLITQFVTEAGFINMIAGICAVIIFDVFQSYFRSLSGIPDSISFNSQPVFWATLFSIMILSTILSGLYPAFALTQFAPITTLKGKYTHSTKGIVLRKGLVVFQFTISILLIAGTFTVKNQLSYLRKLDLGMDIQQVLVLRGPSSDTLNRKFDAFKDDLLRIPAVQSVSKSDCVPGLPYHEMSTSSGIDLVGATDSKNYTFNIYGIDDQFLPIMEIELLAGKNFEPNTTGYNQVLINELSAELLGISKPEEAVGKQLDFWGNKSTIIGVMKNFYQLSPKDPHIPMILVAAQYWNYASIAINSNNIQKDLHNIETVWNTYFPASLYHFFFLDESYQQQYLQDERFSKVFRLLTLMAIVIAVLGLLGISTYQVQQRTKEIGIRKILGASVQHILIMLTQSYIWLISISAIIAIPISWYGIHQWLENFEAKLPITPNLFIWPVILIISITFFTIIWQTIKSATANPVHALRDE